ncbi:MAG: adenylate cyclase [Flaviflexus sp.]|nr:adenylate cyclase [Flaviflexus sp.]
MDVDSIDEMFEFERKFYVDELPTELTDDAPCALILQGYVFAEEGYAIRVRVRVPDYRADLTGFDPSIDRFGAYERKLLAEVTDKVTGAWITVKSPPVSAERYEFDHVLDQSVAMSILQRCPRIIAKNRYSVWLGQDGWEIDEFGGENAGLIIAECERTGPVVDLEIPEFCRTEISSDLRFTNDHLSRVPFSTWRQAYRAELAARGPFFEEL